MPSTEGAAYSGRSLGLDLMRASAVMMVLGSHWISHFGSWSSIHVPAAIDVVGDTGVEIFFALSGFLIGRILIDIAGAQPDWRDFRIFIIRRAMRTLPLYFVWLTFLLCVFPPRQDAMITALRFATLTQNLIREMPANYYFVVTWSLTIEEWFYLLFGFSLIFLSRRLDMFPFGGGRGYRSSLLSDPSIHHFTCSGQATGALRALSCCLAVFMLAPLALRLFYRERGPLVFFRIDEIAYGVLMARLYLRGSWIFRHPWAPLSAGLALIGAALLGTLPIPKALAIALTSNAEVIGGALCLPAALRLTRSHQWFEKPVRWIATRSYALYLIHLTIMVDVVEHSILDHALLPAPICAAVAMVLPFLLAELSYRFLETPMLRWRPAQGTLAHRVRRLT